MKPILLSALLTALLAAPASAQRLPAPPPPAATAATCGKTLAECQVKLDAAQARIDNLNRQLALWRQLHLEAVDRMVVTGASASP